MLLFDIRITFVRKINRITEYYVNGLIFLHGSAVFASALNRFVVICVKCAASTKPISIQLTELSSRLHCLLSVVTSF